MRFKANRAYYADVPNAIVRFWEANLRAVWSRAGPTKKKARFGGGSFSAGKWVCGEIWYLNENCLFCLRMKVRNIQDG